MDAKLLNGHLSPKFETQNSKSQSTTGKCERTAPFVAAPATTACLRPAFSVVLTEGNVHQPSPSDANTGIIEKNMETTTVYWGHTGVY